MKNWCAAIIFPVLSVALGLCGCRGANHQDTLVTSVANPSHTYRATILLRQEFVDGKANSSPATYVLLDKDTGKLNYTNVEFKDSQVVMKPLQCGALSLRWTDDHALKVICLNCGISLAAVGQHAGAIGPIRIEYEGFPDRSSWEPGPGSN